MAMKRIFLYVLTNIAVLVLLSVVVHVLGLDMVLAASGVDTSALLVIAAVLGFAGSWDCRNGLPSISWAFGSSGSPKTPMRRGSSFASLIVMAYSGSS